jgi:uncharacterized repeat protein (TIGR01451 family)
VINLGTREVSNVTISDPMIQPTSILVSNVIAAGASAIVQMNYTITQTNINDGEVVNTATVNVTSSCGIVTIVSDDGNPANGNNNPTVTPLAGMAGLSLIKTATINDTDNDGDAEADETVTYTFTVTNTGNITVNNIVINDALTGTVNLSIAPSTLAPGQVGTATANYTITAADVVNCSITNTATVTGNPTTGGTVTDVSDDGDATNGNDNTTVTVLCTFTSRIAIVKTGIFNDLNADGFAQTGETITYNFTVTNTGNTTLTNIVITDDFLDGLQFPFGTTIDELGPGEINTALQAVYVLTEEDLTEGFVVNQASVRAETPEGDFVTDMSDNDSNSFDEPTIVTFDVDTVIVYNLVSPNIAGYEVLFIKGINFFPENTVEIYNRWGVLVYETRGYNNESKAFRGISEGRVTVDKSTGLPEGTYYYVLKYVRGGDTKEKTGFLHLTR